VAEQPLSQTTAIRRQPAGESLLLSGVDWRTYTRLLRIFAEHRGVRLTYDRGELEIMSPLLMHDDDATFLCRLVFVLTEELNLPVRGGGSTTLRRRKRQKGIESDECFWIANAARMAGKRRLDLRIDPPPDLAIEVDVSHSSLDRMGIYAALRVPEVWRLHGELLIFNILGADGEYQQASHSLSFPLLTPADLLAFVQQAREARDQNVVIRQFREWVRQQIANPPAPPNP
jgi:Uma2 family endonuclease